MACREVLKIQPPIRYRKPLGEPAFILTMKVQLQFRCVVDDSPIFIGMVKIKIYDSNAALAAPEI